MKRILLPTDFSENAYNAIKYAVQLLKQEECMFFILHAYSPIVLSAGGMYDSYSAMSFQKIAQENAETKLTELEETLLKEFPSSKHTFTFKASFNLLISEMITIAEEKMIDFVIMGTQGATGAIEVFLGTHTMFAIKKMKCPVLAVPANFEYEAPTEILFPTDYKINRKNKYFSILRNLCIDHLSKLHILNVYYGIPLTEEQENLKTFLNTYFIDSNPMFHIAEDNDIIGAVEKFQIRTKVNFLVMFHNKHTFFENILFKPVINQLAYHTHVPFLVIPSVEIQKS